MEEQLKEISNSELIQIYRIILEHLDFLANEKKKTEDVDSK